jgi:hypothetical protein
MRRASSALVAMFLLAVCDPTGAQTAEPVAKDAWAAYQSCVREQVSRLMEAGASDEIVFAAPKEACGSLREAAIDELTKESMVSHDRAEIAQALDGLIQIALADAYYERSQAAQAGRGRK